MKRFSILIITLIALSGCASLRGLTEQPELTLVDIAPMESGNLEQRFALTFRLLNPNAVALPVKGLSFDVALQGHKFASGATPQTLNIPAYGNDTFTVEVSTNLLRTATVLFGLFNDPPDKIDYKLAANIRTGVPLFGNLNVVKADSLSLAAFRGGFE